LKISNAYGYLMKVEVFIFNCFDVEICFFNDNDDDGLGELGVEILLRFIFIGV
jgi:hypothetical protein